MRALKRIQAGISVLALFGVSMTSAYAVIGDDACVKEINATNEYFTGFSTQLAGKTSLVSSELVRGFTPFTKRKSGYYFGLPKALGVRATASVPVTTSTKEDYANAALQLRDGALFGLHLSLMASPYWPHWYAGQCGAPPSPSGWVRNFNADRTYLFDAYPVDPWGRLYFTHGLTLKAIRKGLEDDDDDSGASIAGAGTVYFGLGYDGPVLLLGAERDDASAAGTFDIQFGYQYTRVSASTLQAIYDDSTLDADEIEGVFASVKLIITDSVYVDVEYAAPRGRAREFMDDVTTFKIGYSLVGGNDD